MIKTNSAGGVVLNKSGQVLIVDQHGRSWSLPKGHIEEGESALEAAEREIFEESGLTNLEYVCKLGDYERYKIGLNNPEDKSILKHIDMFLFKTDQTKLVPQDPENHQALWVEKNQVSDYLTHREDKKFFKSILEKFDFTSRNN